MNILKPRKPFIIIGLITLFPALTGCQQDPQPNRESAKTAPTTYQLEVGQVVQQSLPLIYSAPGTITTKDQLQISSRITGYIDQVNVSEGDQIEPGDLLVKIDGTQVEAAIKGAKASTRAARAELQGATEDIKRYQTLSKTQAISPEQLQNAGVRQRKAEAALAQALAALEAREQDRRSIHLTSPVQAQVRERLRDQGDLALAGEPILRLDILSTMELEIYLSSTQIDSINVGQKVAVSVPAKPVPVVGEIKRVVRFADPVTRRSKVLIGLPNDIGLSPGQFARADIPLKVQSTLVVPSSAITNRAGISGVFIVDEAKVLRFRSIRVGRKWQQQQEILSGLEPGSQLILNPPPQLRDGDRNTQTVATAP